MVAVGFVEATSNVSYIWYNVVGTFAVVVVGLAVSLVQPDRDRRVSIS
jgi:hypothetical protein